MPPKHSLADAAHPADPPGSPAYSAEAVQQRTPAAGNQQDSRSAKAAAAALEKTAPEQLEAANSGSGRSATAVPNPGSEPAAGTVPAKNPLTAGERRAAG